MIRAAILTLVLALAPAFFLSAASAQITLGSPSWSQLSPAEKQVLAPLAPEWDQWDAQRKQKWRGIAQRYPKMGPDEQQRIQQQMKSWAELTPQQRNAARAQFKTFKDVQPEQKRQAWQAYQNLSPEEKRELAARSAAMPATPGAARAPGMRGGNPAQGQAAPAAAAADSKHSQ